jgi:hypothetical protein
MSCPCCNLIQGLNRITLKARAEISEMRGEGFGYDEILDELPALGMGVTVMSRTPAHCEQMLNAVKVYFIRERIPLEDMLSVALERQKAYPARGRHSDGRRAGKGALILRMASQHCSFLHHSVTLRPPAEVVMASLIL